MFANGLGWPHLLILAVVVMVFFGSNKLPDAARSLGRSMRILKAETSGLRDDDTAPGPSAQTQPTDADTAARQSQLAVMQRQVDELQKEVAARQAQQNSQ
jgi:sec-independent protein translocase protein TatA